MVSSSNAFVLDKMSDDVDDAEEQFNDKQIMYLGGFVLVALIVAAVLIVVFSSSLTGFGPTLQVALATITGRIKGQLPGITAQLEQQVSKIEALATNWYDQVNGAVTDGVTQAINVVLSVGKQATEGIQTGLQNILALLQEMGGDLISYFGQIFSPVVTLVQILGQLLIDLFGAMAAAFLPIIELVSVFVTAVATIGQKF